MKPTWLPFLYFVVGQAAWFACVLSAAHGSPAIGAIVVVILLIAHLARIARPREELKFLAFAVLIGAIWETTVVRLHLLSYPSGNLIAGFAPYWIVALWALFAGQFTITYGWLKGRPVLAAVLGGIAGPLSFRAGAALGAVHFDRPLAATLTLAAGWAAVLPLLLAASRRWNGVRP
jgi:hypothetical protein